MNQMNTATAENTSPRVDARPADPNEAARRELVAWCEAHGLPVPVEHRQPRH